MGVYYDDNSSFIQNPACEKMKIPRVKDMIVEQVTIYTVTPLNVHLNDNEENVLRGVLISYKNLWVVVLTVETNFNIYVQYVKYVKKSIFEYFLKVIIGLSSYWDEFLHMKMKSLMFLEVFCTNNESFSFNINEILDPQILCIFLQKICGIMTF